MTRAPAHPTLPQYDTPQERAARDQQLEQARQSYAWTDAVPSLPGVPLVAHVPPSNRPTLDWSLILVEVGLAIVENALAVDEQSNGSSQALADVRARCAEIAASVASIRSQHAPRTGGGFIHALESLVESVEHDAHLATLEAHTAELVAIIGLDQSDRVGNQPKTIEAYRELFATFPVPAIAYNFVDDLSFARLRVAGPNCELIVGIDALPTNFPLTEAQYAAVVAGDTLATALNSGRLFLCDYAPLSVLVPGEWDGLQKYAFCPMALFAVPPDGDSLVPVAIQCGQDPASNPIFIPSAGHDARWGWEMAKLVVQVADGNFHELFAHLAHTHLVIETIAVATHRHLAEAHPLWALLVPHFEGTLFINAVAASSLIAPNGPIDHIFAGTIQSSQLAAVGARLDFDFYGKMLPADLAARNVASPSALSDYPYRDDALLVWNAIHEWVLEYVRIYYANDDAVTGDTELSAWAETLTTEGKIAGFTPISTREQLAQVCTMIIFTASAQHAAVNFPQKDIMAFAPAVTGAGWAASPASQSGHAKSDWLNMMVPMPLGLEQLNVLMLLGSIHYRPLGDYRSNDFPYPAWFQDPAIIGPGRALERFQSALAKVERTIVTRNANRMWPYPYLQPSLIPTSINI